MYPSTDKNLSYETETEVYFFTNPFYPLDNFSAHTVEIWGHIFNTVEHAYQWKKFEKTDPVLAEKIRLVGSPELAKTYSMSSQNIRDDWEEIILDVMSEIIKAKFSQHADARQMLLNTGDKKLIENSPVDNYWGCGNDGGGKNCMGKILMKVREELRAKSLASK